MSILRIVYTYTDQLFKDHYYAPAGTCNTLVPSLPRDARNIRRLTITRIYGMTQPDVYLKQNDTAPSVRETYVTDREITEAGTSVMEAHFHMADNDDRTVAVSSAATVEDVNYDTNRISVSYSWTSSDTATVGEYDGEFEITYSDSKVETFPKDGYISIEIVEDLA